MSPNFNTKHDFGPLILTFQDGNPKICVKGFNCGCKPFKAFSHCKLSTRGELHSHPGLKFNLSTPRSTQHHFTLSRTHLHFNPGQVQPRASSTRSSARTIHTVHAATRGECFAAAAHAHLQMINPRMRCIETRDRKHPERASHACQQNMAPSGVPAGPNTSFCLLLLLLGH